MASDEKTKYLRHYRYIIMFITYVTELMSYCLRNGHRLHRQALDQVVIA